MTKQNLGFADFREYFTGNTKNYGEHIYKFDSDGKESGSSKTIKNVLLTNIQYNSHLNGKIGLGIIPIDENNKCRFIVADIDIYDIDFSLYIDAIENNNFPLIPFKSKSGGLHIYLFFKNTIMASIGINLIKRLMSYLAIDLLIKNKLNKIIEIFPKQKSLQNKQIGSWINLPYFNNENTKQYAIKNNEILSLEEAIIYIKSKRVSINDAKTFIDTLIYLDAPPCLQTIYLLNPITKDTCRNDYLFSFGVYLKKKDENFFEQSLFKINQTLKNPLISEELEKTILSSLRKKDYTYKCSQSPCIDYCNKNICKQREYGIGKEGSYFSELEYGILSQINTNPPHYKWEIKKQSNNIFKTLSFKNEDEIIKQDIFRVLCFRELHFLPIKMKQTEWTKLVNQYLIDIKKVYVDEDIDFSKKILFKAWLSDFLTGRAMAENKDQIFNNRVYYETREKEYYFRAKDLLIYITNQKSNLIHPNEIYDLLKVLNCNNKMIKTETRKSIRVWAYSESQIHEILEIEEKFKPDFKKYEEEAF